MPPDHSPPVAVGSGSGETSPPARQLSSGKKRSTRACDQCRKAKSRCDLPPDGQSCSNCHASGIECTTSGPTRKRGPPKGYLHAVETRLREVEALLGIILRADDPRVKSFIQDLSSDPFAKTILTRVDLSPFGPTGREATVGTTSGAGDGTRSPIRRRADSLGSPLGPSPEWQDQVIAGLSQSQQSGPGIRSIPSSSSLGPAHRAFGSTGQSLRNDQLYPQGSWRGGNDHDHVESEDERGRYQSQLFPRSFKIDVEFLEKVSSHDAQSEKDYRRGIDDERQLTNRKAIATDLPSTDVQKQLLDFYFKCIHPTFPIISQELFLKEHNQRESWSISFEFLVSTLLAIAGRSIGSDNNGGLGGDASVALTVTLLLEKSKYLIAETVYQNPDIFVCQALLILGLYEFGNGKLTQAWVLIGMAIRVGQDLGLYRSNEKWQNKDRGRVFSEEEREVRKRVWFGCLKADRYLSMHMCRPLCIHEGDFDIEMTIAAEQHEQEHTLWTAPPTKNSSGFYTPAPGCLISCFNASISLCKRQLMKCLLDGLTANIARVVGKILETLYSPTSSKLEIAGLHQNLVGWLERLPTALQVNDHNTMFRAPAHFLALHTEYRSAIILLHRPCLGLGISTSPDDISQAWQECIAAAQQINDITKAWKVNFSLNHATAFVAYDVYHAGLVWAGAAKFRPPEERFTQNLDFCLGALKEMEVTHPSAARARELLTGLRRPPDGSSRLTPTIEQLLSPPNTWGVPLDPMFMNGYIWRGEPPLSSHAAVVPMSL